MPRVNVNRIGTVNAEGGNGADIHFADTERWVLVSPAVWAWIIRALIASGALTAGGTGAAWWMSDSSAPSAPSAQVQRFVQPAQVQTPAPQPAQPPAVIQPMVVQPVVIQPVVVQSQPTVPSRVQVDADINVRAPAPQSTPTGPQSIWSSPANR